MRFLWLMLISMPCAAGDFSLTADAWTQDREEGFGVEYAIGDEWKPSLSLSTYKNDFEEASWYGGVGLSRSLARFGDWDFSASAHLLYFKHSGEDVQSYPASGDPFAQGGDVVVPVDMTLVRQYSRTEYVAPSPALTLSYDMFGVSLAALQLPDEEWSAALQFKITL